MFSPRQYEKRSLAALLTTICVVIGLCTPVTIFALQKEAPAAALEQPVTPVTREPMPPPIPATKTMEVVDNPYGMGAIWAQGDWVAKGTLIILMIMSIGSWYILGSKLLEQRKLFADAHRARDLLWGSGSLEQGVEALSKDGAFRHVAQNAIDARTDHTGALAKEVSLNTWIEMTLERAFEGIQARLQLGLAFLATVGSTAPFIGLFGTVWGIYHALTAIGIAGQASIDKVAGPVGESLIMTAIGLAVAVPAVLGFNWLVRRNKTAMAQVHAFSADLEKYLLGGGKPKVQS